MPNRRDWVSRSAEQMEFERRLMADLDTARSELAQIRAEAAKMDRAITASVQLIEALIAWLPEGQVASSQLGSAHGAWRLAMEDLRR
jgi:hypothetical protein